jgi:hypothetical protein
MREKSSMMPVNMTGYPSARKTALYAPDPTELQFARHRCAKPGRYLSGLLDAEQVRRQAHGNSDADQIRIAARNAPSGYKPAEIPL